MERHALDEARLPARGSADGAGRGGVCRLGAARN
jgi:hypothetical protein